MFKRGRTTELERLCREKTIADGRAKFICREVTVSFVFFLGLMIVLYFSDGRTRSDVVASIIVIVIGVFGGYLHARWRWREIFDRPQL